MTGRSVDMWVGKTADAAIPARVRLRVFERAAGRCAACGRKLRAGDRWECDHTVALINGGAHAESNLRCLCGWCHGIKTRADVREKAKVARVRTKNLGLGKKARWPGTDKFKRRLDGRVVDRETGEPIG